MAKANTPLHLVRNHPGLFIAIPVYIALALSYFFIVPIFEGPDEWTHTGHVKYIAQGNGLPVMLPGQGIWGGQQPPLYYAIGALLVQPFELDGVENYETHRRNPHSSLGYALDPGNKNNYLHSPTENFPYRGLSLTVHVLRLYSMLFGLAALIFIYLTAYEIFTRDHGKNRKWFAATVALFVACQPMFAFITASVANEPANIAASVVAVWLAQQYVLRGPTPRLWRAIALGITLGLVSLSKMTGLSVGLVAVVAMLQAAIFSRKQPQAARLLWRDGVIIGVAFLLVGGWWYWRNYQLYGDFFQQGLYKLYFNVDPQPLTLSQFLYTLSTGEVSFWATFGWLNIVAPNWVYTVYRVISRVGLLGIIVVAGSQFIKQIANKKQRVGTVTNGRNEVTQTPTHASHYFLWPLLIHLVFPVALAFSLTRLVATEGGLQGRQLLPALGSMAIVILWGWWALVPQRVRIPVFGLLFALLLGLAVWMPYSVAAREYTPPPILTQADLPADLQQLNWTFGGDMKLVGAKIGAEVVSPGERVPVTVYWQALQPMETNYSVFVHLIGRDHQSVGQFNTYPGLGLRPTQTLQPDQIFADTYPVRVEGGSKAPTRLRVNVGLFNFYAPGRPGIPAINAKGNEVSPTVGQLKLVPVVWPAPSSITPAAEFADNIRLVNYTLNNCTTNDCTITFEWLAQDTPTADYTVFVQLWQNGEMVTGFDAPPLNNTYPTSLWSAEEVVIDPHRLKLSALAPGEYQIFAGLYNFTTGERLPASTNGTPLPNFALNLGTVQIR